MKLVIAVLALSVAVGCSNGGDSKGGNGGGGPSEVVLKVDTSQPQLNDQQTQEVKAYMKTDAKKLPNSDLLYEAKTDKERKGNQEKIDKLDTEGRANLKALKDNCTVKNKQSKKISGPEEGAMPKAGDVTVTEEYQSITGGGCPATASNTSTMKTTVIEFNYDSSKNVLNRYIAKVEATSVSKNEYRAEPFIRLNNNRTKLILSLNTVGQFELANQVSNTHFKATGSGSAESIDGSSVPVTIEVESLARNDGKVSTSKLIMKYTVKFPSFLLIVQGQQDVNSAGESVQKFYVNGRELSVAEFRNIFGDDFAMNVDGGQVSQN